MDIEKPTQRKTVQWNAQQINANLIEDKQDFRKKVLQFQSHGSQMEDDDQRESSQDQRFFQQKSQKTIQIETNLKKASINRISLKPGKPINLKQINRRISVKQNTLMDEEQDLDEVDMIKKSEFEKKKAKLCNESFPFQKKN